MGIRQLSLVTAAMLRKHKARIALCKGAACVVEFDRVFGTTESNELERKIDGKNLAVPKGVKPKWSRKYDRYSRGSVPDPKTIKLAERAAIAIGNPIRLRYWRDSLVLLLAAEPVISLERIRDIMVNLPRIIRKQLYHLHDMDGHGGCMRQDFDRTHAIALRDRGSLDAFVGLLALAREGEIVEDHPKHAVSARCAFEIFPLVMLDHPQLAARWTDLFEVLKLAFWNREYHGRIYFPEFTLENVRLALDVLSRDRSTKLPWAYGVPSGAPAADE
jgi:hypothetical protein